MKDKLIFIFFILFYLWQLVGMIYSSHPKEGWRNIVLRLPLIIFPMAYVIPGETIKKNVKYLLKLFVIGTLLYLLFCIGNALYNSVSFQNGIWSFNPHPNGQYWLNFFFASELAIKQHPSYLSMYILFSVFISSEFFFNKALNIKVRFIWLSAVFIMLVSIYLLSSRAAILATIVTYPAYILYKLRIVGENRKSWILILLSLIIAIPVIVSNPRIGYYFKGDSKNEISDKVLKESRLVIWRSAFTLIRSNVIFGVGTGDIQNELNSEYKREEVKGLAIENNINAHNQFLEVLLENGLIGLFLFISLFVAMFYIAFSEGNILFVFFLLIVIISFLFETMLNRLAGLSFFALFPFLLVHLNTELTAKKP